MIQGLLTALITPFNSDKEKTIDWKSFDRLVEWQLSSGVDGLVLYGTTGESPTLSHEEKISILKRTKEITNGNIPLVVGAGSNNTSVSLSFIQAIKDLKPDAVLVVAPYYNKPSQEGLFQHFKYLSDNSNLPIIAYNVPSRTSVEISISTLERLSKLENIIGIKQATDSVSNLAELCLRIKSRCSVFSGDDPANLYAMLAGGKGTISASANVLPVEISKVINYAKDEKWSIASSMQNELIPRMKALFLETNPAPSKCVLSNWGLIDNEDLRLPLVKVNDETRETLLQLFPSKP